MSGPETSPPSTQRGSVGVEQAFEPFRSSVMAASSTTVATLPISPAPSSEKRSEDTLRPDPSTVLASDKPQIIEEQRHQPPPNPRLSGILRHDRISVIHTPSGSHVPRQVLINGIPLGAIMFLDLANSADFPANVFNEIPVPTFAAVLMGIGATFALVMSIVALTDARRSWHAIQTLRTEQQELRVRAASAGEKDSNPTIDSFLHLNRRDIGTEFFERFGMEVFMGGAAFLIAVGTYMAIGGANDNVFLASNLLSGYIGNTPAAFYGLINWAWSVIISLRARRQRLAAQNLKGSIHARNALMRRAWLIQLHSAASGVSCLVSGALGMVTPTQWEPYPALAVLGLLFMYTLYLFRTKISYVRAPLTLHSANISTADLVHEIDQLLSLRNEVLATKSKDGETRQREHSRQSLEQQLQKISLCGLFERFCVEILGFQGDTATVSSCRQISSLIAARELTELTPGDFVNLAAEVQSSSKAGNEAAVQNFAFHELEELCDRLLCRKEILRKISMRSRFLLELLGSHMISFPGDRTVYETIP